MLGAQLLGMPMPFAAVHWTPAQAIFDTAALSAKDWGLAFAVASSILLLDEARKLMLKLLQRSRRRPA